jgi:hypothetical protein
MKSLRTKIAAVAIAAAAIIAAPAAASAYTPTPISGPTTIAPGGSGTFSFSGFAPNESVLFTLTGENGAGATLAMVKFAVSSASITKAASGTGAASVEVTLPSNATGTYTLLAAGQSSGDSTSVSITASSSGGSIAETGFDAGSMLGVWIGGGVLLLGGVLVTVFAARRERQDA